jgi:hypothetical protein
LGSIYGDYLKKLDGKQDKDSESTSSREEGSSRFPKRKDFDSKSMKDRMVRVTEEVNSNVSRQDTSTICS